MTSKINPAAEAEAASQPVRKRRIPIWLWVAAPLAVAGFFGWEWVASSRAVGTDNAYIKADRILVAPQIGGRVVEVAVGQNQAVKKGDLLFKIDSDPLEIAVAQNEALVARMANTANASRAQVAGAATSISAAREKLAWARRDLARMEDLSRQQLVALPMHGAPGTLDEQIHVIARDVRAHNRELGISTLYQTDRGTTLANVVIPGLERFYIVSTGNVVIPQARGQALNECVR